MFLRNQRVEVNMIRIRIAEETGGRWSLLVLKNNDPIHSSHWLTKGQALTTAHTLYPGVPVEE